MLDTPSRVWGWNMQDQCTSSAYWGLQADGEAMIQSRPNGRPDPLREVYETFTNLSEALIPIHMEL